MFFQNFYESFKTGLDATRKYVQTFLTTRNTIFIIGLAILFTATILSITFNKNTNPETLPKSAVSELKYDNSLEINKNVETSRLKYKPVSSQDKSTGVKTHQNVTFDYKRFEDTKLVNLLSQTPPKLVPNLKSPCWQSGRDGKSLTCFPTFFVAGYPKSASSDIFIRLKMHHQIYGEGGHKEPGYWNTKGYGRTTTFQSYIDIYKDLSLVYTKWFKNQKSKKPNFIAVDATPATIWDNENWRKLAENKGLKEKPKVTIPDLVHHVLPGSKIILIMRNPADRMYADYFRFASWKMFKLKHPSPEHFHGLVVETLKLVRGLIAKHGLEWCFYNVDQRYAEVFGRRTKVMTDYRFALYVSMYSVHVDNWLRKFPRSQWYFLRTEDYHRDPVGELSKVFEFLDIEPATEEAKKLMDTDEKRNAQASYPPMLPKTRVLLLNFFRPYNERMAQIAGDDRFLWNDS